VIDNLEKSAAKPGSSAGSPLVLTVLMEPGDDSAPLRVLSLLARRRCRVRRASFALGGGREGPVMRLELDPPAGREATVLRWISAIVPVRQVERQSA
jgi:hypothetical protein